MVVVRRVGVLSAFKVGLLVNAVLYLAFGTLFVVPFVLLGGLSLLDGRGSSQAFAAVSLAGSCFMYAAAVAFGAFAGGVMTAIIAALYNLIAGWVGGLEIELAEVGGSEVGKREG